MKKALLFFFKLAVSGIFALAILSILTLVYYNPPKSYAQPDKYTNNKLEPNVFWSDMIEGYGFGRINDLGYNDAEDFDPSEPMIALIGSSHTEALQVPQEKNFSAQLQKRFYADSDENNDFSCLNFGVSGHFFNISASNFEYFAQHFPNTRHAVIETFKLDFTPEELEKMLAGEYHSDLPQRGVLYNTLQNIPYARLIFKQYQDSRKSAGSVSATPEKDYALYEEGMDRVIQKLGSIADEKGFSLSILYHNGGTVKDGKALREDDPRIVEIFQKCCEKYGVSFVDVTDRFVDHFNNTYEHSYGFSNSKPGSGHLNEVGHRLIADELYEHFKAMTEENE